jgi:hypothetical protein
MVRRTCILVLGHPITFLGDLPMHQFVIERDLPGAGALSPAELQGISQKSCAVLRDLGPEIRWQQSYVTADKLYCVYLAPDEHLIREHARRGGFPADRIVRVTGVIGPETAGAD